MPKKTLKSGKEKPKRLHGHECGGKPKRCSYCENNKATNNSNYCVECDKI